MSPTFRSLRVRNYRLFATGQVVSLSGTWGQRVAQDWLVLDFEGVGALDATALDTLAEVAESALELKVRVIGVARANDRVITRLTQAELLHPSGPLRVFPTINGAVRAFRHRAD